MPGREDKGRNDKTGASRKFKHVPGNQTPIPPSPFSVDFLLHSALDIRHSVDCRLAGPISYSAPATGCGSCRAFMPWPDTFCTISRWCRSTPRR